MIIFMEDNTFYPKNDYRTYLQHHGVKGMHWGQRKEYVAHPRVGGAANPNTSMSALGGQSLGDKIRAKREAKYKKNLELAKRRAEVKRLKKARKDPRYHQLQRDMNRKANEAFDKFDNDAKYRKQVQKYILSLNRPDSKDWAKTLVSPKDPNYDGENMIDAVALYLQETDKEYSDMVAEFRNLGRW